MARLSAPAMVMDGSGSRRRPATPIEYSNYERLELVVPLYKQDGSARSYDDVTAAVLTVRTSIGAGTATLIRSLDSSSSSTGYFYVETEELPRGSYVYDIYVVVGGEKYFVTTPTAITVNGTVGRPGTEAATGVPMTDDGTITFTNESEVTVTYNDDKTFRAPIPIPVVGAFYGESAVLELIDVTATGFTVAVIGGDSVTGSASYHVAGESV